MTADNARDEKVPDFGSRDARLVLIGEAPGFYERVHSQPFVGPSGRRLAEWWRDCAPALKRQDFFITNVLDFQPIGNIGKVPVAEIAQYTERLHRKLAELTDPWLIVPTGNVALRALTGNVGITKWRGSILSYKDRRGRTIKVIPTIHPAQILRVQSADTDTTKGQPIWERACRHDWQRIALDAEFRELRLPPEHILINPTLRDLKDYEHLLRMRFKAEGEALVVATDIETVSKGLYCVGFAADQDMALVVNWLRADCRSDEEHEAGKRFIKWLWESAIPKAAQNGVAFDSYIMERKYGIRMRRLLWDTMSMHHCLDPAERHSLEYLTSIFTRIPYYKLEAKEAFRTGNPIGTMGHDKFTTYCGRDCIATRCLVPILQNELRSIEVAA